MSDLTPDQLQNIARGFFRDLLVQGNDTIFKIENDLFGKAHERADVQQEWLESAEERETRLRELDKAGEAANIFTGSAETLLQKHSANPKNTGEARDILSQYIVRAHIEQERIFQAKVRKRYQDIAPIDPLFAGIMDDSLPPLPEFGLGTHQTANTLTAVIEKFKTARQGTWAHKTGLDFARVLKWFQDFMGYDRTLNGLSLVENVPFLKKPWANYKINLRYRPNGADNAILIQVAPKNPDSNLSFMRFVMNPSQYDKADFQAFRAFIEELLVCPDACVSYDDFLVWSKVYRADVAVDILGARPSDLEIIPLVSGKPAAKKKHIYKSATGRTETVYPGAKKAKSSDTYIYDKRKEQEEAGNPPIYGDFLHSRFECRISKTTFFKLAGCTNRCGRVSVRALDPKIFAKEHYTRQLFIRYALERSLQKALAVIPTKYQPKFLKAYNGTMRDIWDAKYLWGFWKDTVKTSGFFFKP